ncbi:glucosyltransferase [Tulasnella sp. JGI-2019a]|nr:glucosyltransferase [Tulasnella sp. JGI-2019a]
MPSLLSATKSMCLYAAWTVMNAATARLVNKMVPDVYMDEPFHITQAQAYCRGEWSTWDPKITTPPGLYILSVAQNYILRLTCNVPNLRLTNFLFLQITPLVIALLLRSTRTLNHTPGRSSNISQDSRGSSLAFDTLGFTLAAFPVLWFFGFLYYTDVGSAVGIVATVLLAREGKHWWAAMIGILSTFFRQTNIIWLGYAFLSFTARAFTDPNLPSSIQIHLRSVPSKLDVQRLKTIRRPADQASPVDLLSLFFVYLRAIPNLISSFLPYLFALIGFVGFIVWNGGIVLGDKSNHVPSTHVPQIFYFIAFATAFAWPALLSGKKYGAIGLVKAVIKRMAGTWRRAIATCGLLIIIEFFIWKYTMHHPFLLSDNRHYTFYLWRRVMMAHPSVPYLLGPIYLICGWTWWVRLAPTSPLIDLLILPLFTLITLLPTPLLEPRYFIIPFLLLRIQLAKEPSRGEWAHLVEFSWYALINIVTMWVFLFAPREPTRGAEDLGIVRFMW